MEHQDSKEYRKQQIELIEYSSNQKMTNSEKAIMKIKVSLIEDLENSINRNSDSSQSLATKIYYLNFVLTAATFIGTIIAILNFFVCE